MNSNKEKIFGYVLLWIGLTCIIFAFYSVYKVFTATTEPPKIFQMEKFTIVTSPDLDSPPVQLTIPLDSQIRKIINVFLYYLFMLFIVAIGGKIGSMGIQFLREIKIEMKKEGLRF